MTSRYIARIYFIILFTFSLFETRVFNFMSLNLFLAYIPFELCLLLRLFKPRKKYEAREVNEALELTSLLGNISHIDDKPFAHLHGTFGTRDFQTLSGHLTKAVVSATAEIVIQMTNLDVNRTHDEETGLNLLRP